ncbi:hypothetical protein NDU88_000320, partial [Pleurodeles waltl]
KKFQLFSSKKRKNPNFIFFGPKSEKNKISFFASKKWQSPILSGHFEKISSFFIQKMKKIKILSFLVPKVKKIIFQFFSSK